VRADILRLASGRRLARRAEEERRGVRRFARRGGRRERGDHGLIDGVDSG
jgi:hypothetical protein